MQAVNIAVLLCLALVVRADTETLSQPTFLSKTEAFESLGWDNQLEKLEDAIKNATELEKIIREYYNFGEDNELSKLADVIKRANELARLVRQKRTFGADDELMFLKNSIMKKIEEDFPVQDNELSKLADVIKRANDLARVVRQKRNFGVDDELSKLGNAIRSASAMAKVIRAKQQFGADDELVFLRDLYIRRVEETESFGQDNQLSDFSEMARRIADILILSFEY